MTHACDSVTAFAQVSGTDLRIDESWRLPFDFQVSAPNLGAN